MAELDAPRQRSWLIEQLTDETIGGALLLAAAAIALLWANSPWGATYANLVNLQVGPAALHLNLSLGTWAADGLLAVFFYVAGLELKHELVLGSLAKPSKAAVPVAAALGGMVVPAVLFAIVNVTSSAGQPRGWGIPMATDIAFALAVLAVVGRALPIAVRAFLLTLAVVDDLGAIVVIAVFYTDHLDPIAALLAIACMVLFAIAQHFRVRTPFVYVPLALATWYFVHDSGIHATVAGIALGLLTRVKPDPGEAAAPADRLQHRLHPLSAAVCVPLFAFFAAGVDLRGIGISTMLATPVAIGVIIGLVIGKPIGVFGTAWLTARFTRARLSSSMSWTDVAAIGVIGGIGFTVSLLIAELAFGSSPSTLGAAKLAVLTASVLAAIAAAVVLRLRVRRYRDNL